MPNAQLLNKHIFLFIYLFVLVIGLLACVMRIVRHLHARKAQHSVPSDITTSLFTWSNGVVTVSPLLGGAGSGALRVTGRVAAAVREEGVSSASGRRG